MGVFGAPFLEGCPTLIFLHLLAALDGLFCQLSFFWVKKIR
jgi:hypothetical protein